MMCMVLVGLVRFIRKRIHLGLVGMILFCVLVAMGDHGFLHPLLYKWLPFYDKIRFPSKFLAYANLFTFLLAGMGVRTLWNWALHLETRKRVLQVMALVAGLFLLAGLLNLLLRPEGGEHYNDAARVLANRHLVMVLALGLLWSSFLGLSWWKRRQWPRLQKFLWPVFAVVLLLDLIVLAPTTATEKRNRLDRPSRVSELLASHKAGTVRLARDANLSRFQEKRKSRSGRESLKMNWGMLENLNYVFGYEPTVPARYDAISGPIFFREFDLWSRVLGVSLSAGFAGILVLRDNYHPGWRAFLDKREVPIYRTNYFTMWVLVGPENRRLDFVFSSWGVELGKTISIISGSFCLIWLMVLWGRRLRRMRKAEKMGNLLH